MSSEGRRRAYLEAMGLEVWVRRPGAGAGAGARRPGPDEATRGGAPPGVHPLEGVPSGPVRAGAAEAPPATRVNPPAGLAGDCAGLDWDALEARVRACAACALSATRTQTVFGVGDRRARWLLVGEAPGAEEDRQGLPFVGRAGQLLTAMLRALGLAREQVYIANILKCRPPGNRDPRPEEVASCEGYLARQIGLVAPGIILALGRVAAQNLLKVEAPLKALRGRRHAYGPARTPVVVTYHPAYLLRNPGDKRRAWEDLQLARSILEEGG